jgi:hypothetical protein
MGRGRRDPTDVRPISPLRLLRIPVPRALAPQTPQVFSPLGHDRGWRIPTVAHRRHIKQGCMARPQGHLIWCHRRIPGWLGY